MDPGCRHLGAAEGRPQARVRQEWLLCHLLTCGLGSSFYLLLPQSPRQTEVPALRTVTSEGETRPGKGGPALPPPPPPAWQPRAACGAALHVSRGRVNRVRFRPLPSAEIPVLSLPDPEKGQKLAAHFSCKHVGLAPPRQDGREVPLAGQGLFSERQQQPIRGCWN